MKRILEKKGQIDDDPGHILIDWHESKRKPTRLRDLSPQEQIEYYCCDSPEVYRIYESLRKVLAVMSLKRAKDDEYRVAGFPHHRPQLMDDDSLVDEASVSLGMGTKMLPSSRYGSH